MGTFDNPYTILASVTITDLDESPGAPILAPITGFQLYLIHKLDLALRVFRIDLAPGDYRAR